MRRRPIRSPRALMNESRRINTRIATRKFKENMEDAEDTLAEELESTIYTGKECLDARENWYTDAQNMDYDINRIKALLKDLEAFATKNYDVDSEFHEEDDESQLYLFDFDELGNTLSEKEFNKIMNLKDDLEFLLLDVEDYIGYVVDAHDAESGYNGPYEHESMEL